MDRIGIFVDAGYLFAQGSIALTGSKQRRSEMSLDTARVIQTLESVASLHAPNASLLRIYWYDGIHGGRMSPEQDLLAHSDNVKVRLGIINSQGQQKGVDSLIVTDLVELARNNAITNAVLLSGDEDVRIGVQIAQAFGVRVHLIGITPSRGSQSGLLIQEADTTLEWDLSIIGSFLRHLPSSPHTATSCPTTHTLPQISLNAPESTSPLLDNVAVTNAQNISQGQHQIVLQYAQNNGGYISPQIDRILLGQGRGALNRDLDNHEKQYLRRSFLSELQRLVSEQP